MKEKTFKTIIFIVIIIFIAGCSFSSKKTIIDSQKNQEVVSKNEETLIGDNLPEANSDNNQNQNADNTNQSDNETQNNQSSPAAGNPSQSQNQNSSQEFKIVNRIVSWGFTAANNRKIDTIIIHSSYNAVGSDEHNLDDIINKEYKPAGVSPHYIISRDGKVYRLVADQNIAYHAGVSKMPDGRTDVNNFSIGIEIVETKSESPSAAEYAALNNLAGYLKGKYKIKNILGHSDIAPGRKDDPWNFSWSKIK